jgi:hypothetical protein
MLEQQSKTTESLQSDNWKLVRIPYMTVEQIPPAAGIPLKPGYIDGTMKIYLLSGERSEIQEEIHDFVIDENAVLLPTSMIGKRVFLCYDQLVKAKEAVWNANKFNLPLSEIDDELEDE